MKAQLVQRWSTPEGVAHADDLLGWLHTGGEPPVGWGRHGDRVDMRGFAAAPVTLESVGKVRGVHWVDLGSVTEFRGVTWRDIDFTYASLAHLRFFASEIVDCVFDRTDCRGWRLWGSTVADVSFEKASLRESSLGVPHDGRDMLWTRVRFDGTDLREASTGPATFSDCQFINVKTRRFIFGKSHIVDTAFVGPIERVDFNMLWSPTGGVAEAPPLTRVDFSEASLVDVAFIGCRFVDVVPPSSDGSRIIARAPVVARVALEQLEGDGSSHGKLLRTLLENQLRAPSAPDTAVIFSPDDYTRLESADFAQFASTILASAQEHALA